MKLEVKKEAVEAKVKEKLAELDNNGKYEMSQNSEEYEKIIQKLEAEVRNHISVRLLLHFHQYLMLFFYCY
jgi:ABC-type Zn2+ transport system substrate-binding protein/surface adhesin